MRLIQPAELITCAEGHVIAEVLAVVSGVDDPDLVRVGLWRPGMTRYDGTCRCSAPFRREGAWHVNKRGWVEG